MKPLHVATAAAGAILTALCAALLAKDNRPEPEPGPWVRDYMADWVANHGLTIPVPAGWVKGKESGKWLWATNTPEWDRDWFDKRGWRFPRKWVVYNDLKVYASDSGATIELEGL
ncbi:hypothetical protein J4U01_gp054 [Mycobacterium phage Kumao]|uniref:Uncharacterized protein n=1 Tax=Mycobacterium phage Kumao TaxID=2041344 RepID=A0A2D1GPR9_9CAUD|nr:hypothetical protein J4U01_gp054 [Mycobacterium phage Kumao]ATN94017.1 hypothetical protein SEA_KUMAO_54 [Mycobacterium phage Kumao]